MTERQRRKCEFFCSEHHLNAVIRDTFTVTRLERVTMTRWKLGENDHPLAMSSFKPWTYC